MILDLHLCFIEISTRSCNDSRCGYSDEHIISCKAIPFKIRCCTYFLMFYQGYISPPPQIINPLFAYFCSSCWIFSWTFGCWLLWSLSQSDNERKDAKAQQAAHLSSKSVKSHVVHMSSIYNQGIHVALKLGLDHVFIMDCWRLSNLYGRQKRPYCRTGLCSSG